MSQHFSGAPFGSSLGLRETMLALATAGGPTLAGLLWEMTGSYAVPWLAATTMFGTAIPLTLSVGFRPIMPDARSSR
jgi:hypothetical protein